MDSNASAAQSVIALQYKLDSLSRTLQIQPVQAARAVMRSAWVARRSRFEAELDATGQLKFPD